MTNNPPVKNSTLQCPLRNVHLNPNGGLIQKQTSLVNQHECDGMLSLKIVYSSRFADVRDWMHSRVEACWFSMVREATCSPQLECRLPATIQISKKLGCVCMHSRSHSCIFPRRHCHHSFALAGFSSLGGGFKDPVQSQYHHHDLRWSL
jgi:hypothetical protein